MYRSKMYEDHSFRMTIRFHPGHSYIRYDRRKESWRFFAFEIMISTRISTCVLGDENAWNRWTRARDALANEMLRARDLHVEFILERFFPLFSLLESE